MRSTHVIKTTLVFLSVALFYWAGCFFLKIFISLGLSRHNILSVDRPITNNNTQHIIVMNRPPPQWRNAINAHARQHCGCGGSRRRRQLYISSLFPSSSPRKRPFSMVNRADAHKGKCARPKRDLDVRACERRRRRRYRLLSVLLAGPVRWE